MYAIVSIFIASIQLVAFVYLQTIVDRSYP
jgi:hypothetical protein